MPQTEALLTFSEGLSIILESVKKIGIVEKIPIEQAYSRIIADHFLSSESLPSFRNSAMDGFAVVAGQTQGASLKNPLLLKVLGSISAGDLPPSSNQGQGVWEIMTGAPFPEGYDATLKVEDVQVETIGSQAKQIQIFSPAKTGQYSREAGSDLKPGDCVVRKGTSLAPKHLLALSSLGVTEVQVFGKPKVAIVSTGKELANPGDPLRPGQIRNSTTPFLTVALQTLGAEIIDCKNVEDDPQEFSQAIESALTKGPDLVLTTGGVSMGKYDFVAECLKNSGAKIHFHKLAIRPGKPHLFAKMKNGTPVFGLPGNPISTVVGLRFLVEPFLREMVGQTLEKPWQAVLREGTFKPSALRCFYKASLDMTLSSASVQILQGQDSYRIRSLLEANAWAVLPEQKSEFKTGDLINVYPLHSENGFSSSPRLFNSTGLKEGVCEC